MAASLQRLVISLLVVLTFTFVYFAQVTEAAGKGPRITHKVRSGVSIHVDDLIEHE
jgi:peptidyl-prolyl cis-trans isomerase B (cyclophilin B)